MQCKNCSKIIDVGDNFCRFCGSNQNNNKIVNKNQNDFWKSELGIIILTLIMGPISLFYLYKSNTISEESKKKLFIGILFFSLVVFFILFLSFRILFRYYIQIFKELGY